MLHVCHTFKCDKNVLRDLYVAFGFFCSRDGGTEICCWWKVNLFVQKSIFFKLKNNI